MPPPATKRMTYAEYLAREADSDEKHEWLDGEVFAMAGGSILHARLAMAVTSLLLPVVRTRGCELFGSDLRVRIPESGLATYPDLTLVCGPVKTHPEDQQAVTNPVLLVEVLSPSTERWDQDGKFRHYELLASLRSYVLVSQDHRLVQVYEREAGGPWTYRWARSGRLALLRDEVELDLDALFEGTDLPDETPPPWRIAEPEVPAYLH